LKNRVTLKNSRASTRKATTDNPVGRNAFRFGTYPACGLVLILAVSCAVCAAPLERGKADTHADALVEQLRNLPPQIRPDPISVLCSSAGPCSRPARPPEEAKRGQLYDELYELGPSAVPALARALQSPDVGLRRNAALALDVVGGGWWFHDRRPPKIDISAALPALIAALDDSDPNVRWAAASDIGYIGPAASQAVPKLVALLGDSSEGVRNNACFALGGIGPSAKSALPALKQRLSDHSMDVRRSAQSAIDDIDGKSKAPKN
jgi:hypothetical protein